MTERSLTVSPQGRSAGSESCLEDLVPGLAEALVSMLEDESCQGVQIALTAAEWELLPFSFTLPE